jgi:hypothetical protein
MRVDSEGAGAGSPQPHPRKPPGNGHMTTGALHGRDKIDSIRAIVPNMERPT